ncbi:hypothetical protein CARUB_v10020757mg [Capsella rubella]|uniref:DUF4408 domain-containing protein n=1 Tax=Capsella rubella TaxID=81985 RepID=R0GIL8_9BRAS|nr:uncharacterized protein LOC17894576 [Capsella rubella]EOA35551.1 hypothetical protein CARUB_v10020757mg [Capsella rubella]
MMKQFEYHGVEAEKAEAMRRYNNRRSFRNLLRFVVVVSLCYLLFPTVASSLQTVGDWIYRTGSVMITGRSLVFVFANLIVASIFLLSGQSNDEKSRSSGSSNNEPDLYDQYTSSSSAVIVTASEEKVVEVDDDDSNKQIVPAYNAEVKEAVTMKKEILRPVLEYRRMESAKVVEDDESDKQIVPALIAVEVVDEATEKAVTTTGIYRRTKSEAKKEKFRPTMEYRRTESAKVGEMETLSSEEFRLKVESFIMEKKRMLVLENDVVQYQGQGLGSRHSLRC